MYDNRGMGQISGHHRVVSALCSRIRLNLDGIFLILGPAENQNQPFPLKEVKRSDNYDIMYTIWDLSKPNDVTGSRL